MNYQDLFKPYSKEQRFQELLEKHIKEIVEKIRHTKKK